METHKVQSLESSNGYCFDEGALQFVTGLNQWLAYLSHFTLSDELHRVQSDQANLFFGRKGQNSVTSRALEIFQVRFPLPDYTCFEYKSFLISNNIPMLLGLNLQRKLYAVTDKDENLPTITFRKVGIKLSLIYKDCHIYYEGSSTGSFLFATVELAWIHRNLGHASAGAVYSALKLAYPIETDATDLIKLHKFTKSCKVCWLYAKQPNRCWAVLPDQCVFNFNVAINVMYIKNRHV